MPFLFDPIDSVTSLLLPDDLTRSDSIIADLVQQVDEESWQQVEIIGWLYQFYISELKDEVIGKVVATEDIPYATQLFTELDCEIHGTKLFGALLVTDLSRYCCDH
jgi:hypothetical protein